MITSYIYVVKAPEYLPLKLHFSAETLINSQILRYNEGGGIVSCGINPEEAVKKLRIKINKFHPNIDFDSLPVVLRILRG
jgi:hypothetical protein